MIYQFTFLLFLMLFSQTLLLAQKPQYKSSKFEQLGTELPTPNTFRLADGSPGPDYWQQKADYKIKISLDDDKQFVKGSETITYYNYSPRDLTYIWVQLDQNLFDKNSDTPKISQFSLANDEGNLGWGVPSWLMANNSKGGYSISNVKDNTGKPLLFIIQKTMMRIDLPKPLKAKTGVFTFSLDWENFVGEVKKQGGRGGYEHFPKDKNNLYEMAQWFPRMAVYDDVNGWQHKQFLGQGEFALTFGDYEVEITVPADHIVASTGELQNASKVLTPTQIQRLKQAETATSPVVIVTQKEAEEAEKNRLTNTKTWIYKAKNVRDFAWASSRKFIWDAMRTQLPGGKKVWSMSYYPKEGNPLWGDYSTRIVDLTLKVYSKHTIDYPYPVAISVHGAVFGMEYPMICFNGGRPNEDGTVSDGTKNAMFGVIIHEVGHNFFPMIINSDERQWSWMDEGLNTFCQYLTECELPKEAWAKTAYPTTFPSRRGPAKFITNYMASSPDTQVPIMTNSESILQFGNNAYGKPATALNILRETIMGRELFDFAFKQYSEKWAFKHPMPADFFRTMEDASAVDLDWFWRGWFYTTEPCDIAIEDVVAYKLKDAPANTPFTAKAIKMESWERVLTNFEKSGVMLSTDEKNLINANTYFYQLKYKNIGGLLSPIIVQANYKDGSTEILKYPAEIWRNSPEMVTKVMMTNKEVVSFSLDPNLETADIDIKNNVFPRNEKKEEDSKFKEFKKKEEKN